MNNEQTPALREAVENMANMREAYDNLSQAAEAYNTGKTELAANITAKGVPASATETLPELAGKVSAIAQQPIILSPSEVGDMYVVQQFGALTTPNYWNLYEVLNTLLNDGRLLNYGGILLAEYYKGYDSLALSGAGAGGAYVVSDMENGQFKMYTEDTTHVWDTEEDGKGNRFVAYCFADEYHDFQITDTNTSPRSIFIGRKVGTITALVNTRVSQIVVPNGSRLVRFNGGTYSHNFGQSIVIFSENTPIINITSANEKIYYRVDKWDSMSVISQIQNGSVFIYKILEYVSGFLFRLDNKNAIIYVDCDIFTAPMFHIGSGGCKAKKVILNTEQTSSYNIGELTCDTLYIGYKTNDKTRAVNASTYNPTGINNIELQSGWCKPITINNTTPTEVSIYTYILQRLKQDEPDCGDGVTITLGATNLAKLTSQESIDLLDLLTNTYGYTFA